MTTVTVAETIYSVTVADDTYTVTVADSQETVNVSIASAAADTQVINSGSGTSLIKSSTGGVTTLRSVAGGNNVTLADDGSTITISATEDDLSNNTTDNLSEGTTNKYFTDARVMTALETVSGHVIPSANVTYDLGSTTSMWRDAYIGPGSLYINGQKVISSDTGEINITTDANENLNIQAGGDITVLSAGLTTNIQDTTVNLGPANNTGTTNVRGTLDVAVKIEMGDLDLTSGLIHQDSGTNLVLRTNSGHNIVADTDVLLVGAVDGTNTQITPTGITGTLTGTVSSIANHTTANLTENTNLYYTDARADARVNLQTGANLDLSNKSTTNLTEGSNLYYTNARADARAQLKIDALVDSAPGTLDTLNELAAALGDDANFSTTVTNSIATKLATADFNSTFDTRLGTKDTDNISEGSSNLYYTDARFNTAFGNKSTNDLTENTNLYYTDARARAAISENSTQLAYNNSTGVLTYTQGDTDTVSEGSSNLYHTSARAIAAVEGESTLDLTGALTVDGQISTDNVFKVDDGFTQTSFNPYGAGNDMPTRVCGIGADDGGWASLHVRSRGEHDFGIGSQYNLIPRALMALSAGRKDGSSDDYLNNNDTFGAVMYNPYSGYRTGTEWLTPSATIYGVATEDHSASGMGTKLDFSTTENTNKAGAADLAHTNGVISFQGTTITSSGTLKIDDDLIVTGSISDDGGTLVLNDATDINGLTQVVGATNNKTVIGDQQIASTYNITGVKVQADETKWANILLQEYEGAGGKPASSGFTNPTFGSEIIGGTVASPGAVSADKRLFVLQSLAANATDGSLPTTSNFRILAQTSQAQTSSNRGTFVDIDTTADDANGTTTSLRLQGATVNINPDGNGVLKSGGDLTLDDNVIVTGTIDLKGNISNSAGDVTVNDNIVGTGNLTINGNTVLGDSNADTITCNGKLTAVNGFVNTILDVSTANALAGMGLIDEGAGAYISDGNAGSKCFAVFDGTNWKVIAFGNNISSS